VSQEGLDLLEPANVPQTATIAQALDLTDVIPAVLAISLMSAKLATRLQQTVIKV